MNASLIIDVQFALRLDQNLFHVLVRMLLTLLRKNDGNLTLNLSQQEFQDKSGYFFAQFITAMAMYLHRFFWQNKFLCYD